MIVSDLIIEAAAGIFHKRTPYKKEKRGSVTLYKAVLSKKDAQIYKRRAGTYFSAEGEESETLIAALGEGLCSLIEKTKDGSVLVTGLGNEDVVCDALGSETLKVLKISDENEFYVFPSGMRLCALAPSVSARTGMESIQIVKAVCDKLRPAALIAVDTLCTSSPEKLGKSYQITDAGIRPGSAQGEGKRLSKEYLGVPVIALGVPLVLKTNFNGNEYLLASKNADAMVAECARVIGGAINAAMESLG